MSDLSEDITQIKYTFREVWMIRADDAVALRRTVFHRTRERMYENFDMVWDDD